MTRKIRTLLFSSLYPNGVRPGHGIFVETRLRELLKSGEVETKVVAPVPWFFSTNSRFGEYATTARIPSCENHNGVEVTHPRYALIPKVGMTIAPFAMALSSIAAIKRMRSEGFDFDLIDAHYYYPDGVAAALIAWWFKKPFVITARGSDVNLISRYRIPRLLMRWASCYAKSSIAVSKALSEALASIGMDRSKLMVLRNGVDSDLFYPTPQAKARDSLGWLPGPTLISVGNLVENKGHHVAIELLAHLPDFRLAIVGTGVSKSSLERLSQELGVSSRVSFLGRLDQKDLAVCYSAADILVLASSREGWPNVLLEAMACGTPVVASNVGGVPEIVTCSEAGRLARENTVESLLPLVRDLWNHYPDRNAVRRYAELYSWDDVSRFQIDLFKRILNA